MEASINGNKSETIEHEISITVSKIKSAAVRSAEKKRLSSCRFADLVAQLSIEAYKQTFSDSIRQQYDQTVLAAILVQVPVPCSSETEHDAKSKLLVVSLGVGTKVVSAEKIVNERQRSIEAGCGDRIVRDMHAEVLARRGFQRFLINTLSNPETCSTLFISTENGFILNPDITVHLYSSSQPCGNACDKRWAKGRHPKLFPGLPADQWPVEEHEKLSLSHVIEGQIAVMVKTNLHLSEQTSLAVTDSDDSSTLVGVQRLHKKLEANDINLIHQRGNILSCSDKIAVWMSLGIQGSLLLSSAFSATHRIAQPIYLSTITVGRKYSAPHAQRAFCCRISDFSYPPQPSKKKRKKQATTLSQDHQATIEATVESKFSTHHPAILCTAVKFDEGSLLCEPCAEQTSGAQFMNQKCLVAWLNPSSLTTDICSYEYELLDGRSGLALSQSPQQAGDELVVSRMSSFSQHQDMLVQHHGVETGLFGIYLDIKNAATEYQVAKHLLRSQQPFDVWTGKK